MVKKLAVNSDEDNKRWKEELEAKEAAWIKKGSRGARDTQTEQISRK